MLRQSLIYIYSLSNCHCKDKRSYFVAHMYQLRKGTQCVSRGKNKNHEDIWFNKTSILKICYLFYIISPYLVTLWEQVDTDNECEQLHVDSKLLTCTKLVKLPGNILPKVSNIIKPIGTALAYSGDVFVSSLARASQLL